MRRIRLGNLEIDGDRFEVHIEGERIELTFLEFELLSYLAQHSRRVAPSDRLIEAAWGEPAEGNSGKLRIHISRLRKKIRKSEPWRIETSGRTQRRRHPPGGADVLHCAEFIRA